MNELDLNKAVAVKLGFTGVVLSLYGPPSVRAIASDESMLRSFDFCNNWQDAGPIIEKYKISLQYEYMMGSWSADCVTHSILDDSPLKAAMLCFLEMEIN